MSAEGIVATFYSFKGGVGRTLGMASMASLLARWGYRVLCVDWDLEAPGLANYFSPWSMSNSETGLLDLIESFEVKEPISWTQSISEVSVPDARGTLHLIAAGGSNQQGYAGRVQKLDWGKLYAQHNIGLFFENLRAQWKERYDFICIDSRTGFTDIGGVCTVQFPDVLILFFTANWQSMRGCLDVWRMADQQRNRLPFDRERLLALPIPTRFETRTEYEQAQHWLQVMAKEVGPVYEMWLDKSMAPLEFLEQTKVPYVPYWSFGERVPVIEKGTRDPDDLGWAYEGLASLIAQRLADTLTFVRDRNSYVTRTKLEARAQQSNGEFDYDVFVSFARHDLSFARGLAAELNRRGRRVFIEADELLTIHTWGERILDAVSRAQHFVFVIGRDFSSQQRRELSTVSEVGASSPSVASGSPSLRRILPVVRDGASLEGLPSILMSLRHLREEKRTPEELADEIVKALEGSAEAEG